MASAEEAGEIILEVADKEESQTLQVLNVHTSRASQGTKTPTGETFKSLPVMPGNANKGKRLILSVKTDATDTLESEESDVLIPIDLVSLSDGSVIPKDLKLESFTGFKPSGSVDIACTADTKTRLAYYDAPEGYVVAMGAGRPFHAYLGDDTA